MTSVAITQYFETKYWKNGWDEELIKSREYRKILEEIVEELVTATVSEACLQNMT